MRESIENSLVVLKSIIRGIPVEIDGYRYVLGQVEEGGRYKLCVVANNDKLLTTEWDLGSFINRCSKIDNDEIFIIGANITLNEMHKEGN